MAGLKVAVISGANQGIGFAVVKELCKSFDGSVYLTSRDEHRGRAAVEELEKLGFHPKYHQLDIDDEASVLKLRDHLKATYGGLDILVNNAGMLIVSKDEDSRELFAKSARSVLQTNFFNTYRACNILFPILRPHARVVNLSSSMGHLLQIDGQHEPASIALRAQLASTHLTYDELFQIVNDFLDAVQRGDHPELGWPKKNWVSYIASKIAVSAMTRIQQRDFDVDSRQDIIVNHVHPGFVRTTMAPNGVLTIEEGAVAPAWLAMLPPNNATNPKGSYVWHDKQIVDWVNGPTPSLY